jgi:transposase
MKARVASAHLILTLVYNIIKTGEPYQELGPDYLKSKQTTKEQQEQKMIELLKKKGYKIELTDQDQQTA